MSDGLRRGIDLFNAGRYWDAHEVWEHDWMPDRKGPDAGFYKGLIQVAAGCLHFGRRNRRGTVNKWRSGADYLRPYLPEHRGVQLAALVAAVDGFLVAMGERGTRSPLTRPPPVKGGGQDWPELTMPAIELQE